MPFTSTCRFPFTVGGVVVASALVLGVSGLVSNLFAGCVFIPGALLWFDASIGTQALGYYFLSQHSFTQRRVEDLYFARPTAFLRYVAAIALSAIFALLAGLLQSDLVTCVGLVTCVVGYGLIAGAGLVSAIRKAAREVSLVGISNA